MIINTEEPDRSAVLNRRCLLRKLGALSAGSLVLQSSEGYLIGDVSGTLPSPSKLATIDWSSEGWSRIDKSDVQFTHILYFYDTPLESGAEFEVVLSDGETGTITFTEDNTPDFAEAVDTLTNGVDDSIDLRIDVGGGAGVGWGGSESGHFDRDPDLEGYAITRIDLVVNTIDLEYSGDGLSYKWDFTWEIWGSPARIEVSIDIKPCSDPNAINPNNKGVIPVAIQHTDEFNPIEQVNVDSLRFGAPETVQNGDGALPAHGGHVDDVIPCDGDGREDLVLQFPTEDTGLDGDVTSGRLEGETDDGTPLFGADSVEMTEG